MKDLIDRLEHLAEHIGDDDYNLPLMAKSTVLEAAKALRQTDAAKEQPSIFGGSDE